VNAAFARQNLSCETKKKCERSEWQGKSFYNGREGSDIAPIVGGAKKSDVRNI